MILSTPVKLASATARGRALCKTGEFMLFVLGILWYFCWKLILCLVSDEWGPIGPYETDLSDYVAGSTKFNKFYIFCYLQIAIFVDTGQCLAK